MKFRSVIVIILLSAVLIPGKSLSLEIGSAYNQFNSDVKDIYSGSNISYGIDLAYNISGTIELFIHTDILSAKGELTYTKEDTTLNLTPLELGGRFVFGRKFSPYFGIGVGSYNYKESNPIGNASGSGFGFFGEGGFFINFGKMFFDTKIKYVALKIDNVDLSNIKGLIGIGIRF